MFSVFVVLFCWGEVGGGGVAFQCVQDGPGFRVSALNPKPQTSKIPYTNINCRTPQNLLVGMQYGIL